VSGAGFDPDLVRGLSEQRLWEMLRCMPLFNGVSIFSGASIFSESESAQFAWSGNTNVVAWWQPSATYMSKTGSDIDSWQTRQAYTAAGASTTYTFLQSGSRRPSHNATGLGGDGSVVLDGSAEILECTDANFLDLPEGDDAQICVIATLKPVSTASGDHFWGWYLTSGGDPIYRFIRAGAFYRTDRGDNASLEVNAAASESVSDGTSLVVTQRFRTSPSQQIVHAFDGAEDASSPHAANVSTMSGFDTFVVGASKRNSATPSAFAQIEIGDIFVVLNNDSVIDDIVSYL